MTRANNHLTEQIIAAVTNVLKPKNNCFIPLHEPVFSGKEKEYVNDAIDSTFVSSVGPYVDRFEQELASYCGVERAVVTVNGTAALHVCLMLAGVQSGDEVLAPALTFVATANAVSYVGAVPHFVDCEEITLGLDPVKLAQYLEEIAERRDDACFNKRTGRKIAAIVPMHTFGHPVRLRELLEVAEKWAIPVVEDAAESLGSYYGEKQTGGFGLVAAVSFNGNKIMTTGGGGAVLTNNHVLADRAKHLTTTAKKPHKWEYEHDIVGYNYRMPNLNAALGLAQLEQMPEFLANKRVLASHYADAFSGIEGLRFMTEPVGCTSNYWLNALILDEKVENALPHILDRTNSSHIMTRPAWKPMHQLAIFRDCPRMDLAVTGSLAKRILNIPSSSQLALSL